MIRTAWLVAAMLGVCACKTKPTQSFHDAVQALCDLPDHVPDNGEPFEQRLAAAAKWADANITDPGVRELGSIDKDLNKDRMASAAQQAGILRCKLLDNGMALQSYSDAMKVMCDASSPHDPTYFKSHLLNPEVIRLFESLGNLSPQDASKRFADALARAGIGKCAAFDARPAPAGHVPTVTGAGFVPLEHDAAVLLATPRAIVIDGKAIVAVENGAVAPAELEGGALGLTIVRVRTYLKAFAAQLESKGERLALALAIDPTLPYNLLIRSVFSAKQAGFTHFQLIVRVGDTEQAIPIDLPQARPPGKPSNLGMTVSITKDKLLLWSISGQEGSLKQPKLTAKTAAELGPALAEIVERRWKTAKRSDDDRAIIVMADAQISMQEVADVLAAVRASADGKELFPRVLLSAGFE